MKFIWVRHGETDLNKEKKYVGHFDAQLNDTGIEQAEKMAILLKELKISHIFTSDLKRAHETANIIGEKLQLRPEADPSLRELDFGDWDVKTYDEIMASDYAHATKWFDNPFHVNPPNGETLLQLGERVDGWLSGQVAKGNRGDDQIIIVSHGGPIRWFLSTKVYKDFDTFWKIPAVGHGKSIEIEYLDEFIML